MVVFQPHLYSRTATFADAFGVALGGADLVVVLDVYGAREDPQPGVSGELIAAAVPAGGAAVLYHPDRASAAAFVAGVLRPGDIVITMGAGDVTAIGPELLTLLEANMSTATTPSSPPSPSRTRESAAEAGSPRPPAAPQARGSRRLVRRVGVAATRTAGRRRARQAPPLALDAGARAGRRAAGRCGVRGVLQPAARACGA